MRGALFTVNKTWYLRLQSLTTTLANCNCLFVSNCCWNWDESPLPPIPAALSSSNCQTFHQKQKLQPGPPKTDPLYFAHGPEMLHTSYLSVITQLTRANQLLMPELVVRLSGHCGRSCYVTTDSVKHNTVIKETKQSASLTDCCATLNCHHQHW